MADNNVHLIHANNSETEKNENLTDVPKLPQASRLEYGEIAVNYAAGFETLSIKNSNDDIVTFSSDERKIFYVTYAEMVSKKTNRELLPGQFYCIYDYITKTNSTTSSNYKSIGDDGGSVASFPIVVQATRNNEINETAKVLISEEGFTTYTKANAWEIKYCLENDTDRFAWASQDGMGVIYYMKDEWGNECPYDFKSIQFKRTIDGNDYWCFTFTHFNKVNLFVSDASRMNENGLIHPKNNIIKPAFNENSNVQVLNDIVFIGDTDFDNNIYHGAYGNTFDNTCVSMTFGNEINMNTFGKCCSHNTFGDNIYYNTFGERSNGIIFGNGCTQNTIGSGSEYITLGENCQNNSFGNGSSYITLGENCQNNSFGNCCTRVQYGSPDWTNIVFGTNCSYNTLGNYCRGINFGNKCKGCIIENGATAIKLTGESYNSVIVEGHNQGITVKYTGSDSVQPKPFIIKQFYNRQQSKNITIDTSNQTDLTVYRPSSYTEIDTNGNPIT